MLPALLNLKRLLDHRRTSLGGIVVLAFLIRGMVAVLHLDQFQADPDAYRSIAETLKKSGVYGLTAPSGEVIATAFRPPLYPLLLSWGFHGGQLSQWVIASLHVALGVATAVFTYLASLSLLGTDRGRGASILAGFLVIVDPILIQQSTLVMTETLAAALVSLILWWWLAHLSKSFSPISAVVLGALLVLAYFCRPTFLVWSWMLIGGLLVGPHRSPTTGIQRLLVSGLAALVLLCGVAAWTFRNETRIGHPVWATTHGGYTLLLGNNPLFYRHLREAGLFQRWDAQAFLTAYSHRFQADPTQESFWFDEWSSAEVSQAVAPTNFTEHDDDQLSYHAAMATIDREPKMFIASCLVRVYRLWTPLPFATADRSLGKRLVIGVYYSLLYLGALVGLKGLVGSSRWFALWPLVSLVVTLTVVHAVYWSNMRMRAPAIPAIAILAANSFRREFEAKT